MNGVPINCQSGPIEICQLGKWTGMPVFKENLSMTQGLNISSRHNKITGTVILKK